MEDLFNKEMVKNNLNEIKKIIKILSSLDKIDNSLIIKQKKNEKYILFLETLLQQSNENLALINKK